MGCLCIDAIVGCVVAAFCFVLSRFVYFRRFFFSFFIFVRFIFCLQRHLDCGSLLLTATATATASFLPSKCIGNVTFLQNDRFVLPAIFSRFSLRENRSCVVAGASAGAQVENYFSHF